MCARNDKEEKFSLLRIIIYKLKWYEMIEYHVLSILDLVEKRELQLWKKNLEKKDFIFFKDILIYTCMYVYKER